MLFRSYKILTINKVKTQVIISQAFYITNIWLKSFPNISIPALRPCQKVPKFVFQSEFSTSKNHPNLFDLFFNEEFRSAFFVLLPTLMTLFRMCKCIWNASHSFIFTWQFLHHVFKYWKYYFKYIKCTVLLNFSSLTHCHLLYEVLEFPTIFSQTPQTCWYFLTSTNLNLSELVQISLNLFNLFKTFKSRISIP